MAQELPDARRMKSDPLGDRVKAFEDQANAEAFAPHAFVLARVDGRAFHTFTKDFNKPASHVIIQAMLDGTVAVASDLKSRLAYFQSDEATFCWHYPVGSTESLPFSGRKQKLCSLIAACFTSAFITSMVRRGGALNKLDSGPPMFDCRIWEVPSHLDQYEAFLWREKDAVKNAVSSAASTIATPAELKGLKHRERLALIEERGFDFQALPHAFRHGAYVRRITRWAKLDELTRSRIPLAKLPPPDHLFERHEVREDYQLTSISQVDNLEDFLVRGVEPALRGLQDGQSGV